MKYQRSRPWRSRGPWFSNRAGARRRGRRDDELVLADSGCVRDGDNHGLNAGIQDTVVESVLPPGAETWSLPRGMVAARVDEDRILSLAPGLSAYGQAPRQIDQIADAVIAAHMLSRQGEDDADTSRSRQSA